MLAEQFTEAAAVARNSAALDLVARQLWAAHGEGHLADADALAISEAVQARRAALARQGAVSLSKPASARRRPATPRSPDRQASLERRRRQAASGAMPPALASRFTQAELAVLAVIARQCQRGGACSLPLDAVAALAGVCRTSVKNAVREARLLGLILVRERRIPGRRSLTNIVTVISRDWLGWLRLRAGTGGKSLPATDTRVYSPDGNAAVEPTLRHTERLRRNFWRETPPPHGGGRGSAKR